MRLDAPRVPPVPTSELDDDQRQVMEPLLRGDLAGQAANIFHTLVNYPDLMRRWMVFANHVLGKSSLTPRDRELVILRIGWLCRSGYEFGQHVLIARRSDISDEEIERLKAGPEEPGWSEAERALLEATDELHADAFVSDETWAVLSRHYSTQQLMDIVFAVGQYNLVSMALNTFGVQPDEDIRGLWP